MHLPTWLVYLAAALGVSLSSGPESLVALALSGWTFRRLAAARRADGAN